MIEYLGEFDLFIVSIDLHIKNESVGELYWRVVYLRNVIYYVFLTKQS